MNRSILMQRMRVLALQSGSGANTAADRIAPERGVSAAQSRDGSYRDKTTFAGQNLLAGSFKGLFPSAYAGENMVITGI